MGTGKGKRNLTKKIGLVLLAVASLTVVSALISTLDLVGRARAQGSTFSLQLGPETVVLDLAQRQVLGFQFGPSDGYLGVLRQPSGHTFFVPAESNGSCVTPNTQGTYRLGGSLTDRDQDSGPQLTNAFGCSVSLPNDQDPHGYSFDRDYSGG